MAQPQRPQSETAHETTAAERSPVYEAAPSAEEVATETPYVGGEIQDEIVEYIALYLQVPPEAVWAGLEMLGMQPEALVDSQTANRFLQTLLDKKPAELLYMPEYQDMLTGLTKGTEDIIALPPEMVTAQVSQTTLDRLAAYQATVDDQNQLVVEVAQGEADSGEAFSQGDRNPETALRQEALSGENYGEPATLPEVLPMLDGEQPTAEVVVNPIAAVRVEAAALAATQRNAAPAPVDATSVMEQIVSRVKIQAGGEFTELRMTLRPESLGEVSLRIATQNGLVTAMFVAESQRVREIIESNFDQLRDALSEQGIEVSQLSVSVGGQDAEERMNQFLKAQQENMQRMQRIAGLAGEAEEETLDEPVIALGNTVDYSA